MRTVVPAVLIGLAMGASSARAQAPSTAVIAVSGASTVKLPPDGASLDISITTRASTAAAAAADNGRKQVAVLAALRQLGYGPNQARATNFNVSPVRDYSHPTERTSEYDADITVAVAVTDLTKLGSTIDAALAAGGTALSRITFTSDSAATGRQRALGLAYDAAREQAEALAKAAGGHLGHLVELSTLPPPTGGLAFAALQPGVLSRGSVAVTPRDVEINATVYARWELAP